MVLCICAGAASAATIDKVALIEKFAAPAPGWVAQVEPAAEKGAIFKVLGALRQAN
jgi:hypothetical protein